MLKVIHWYIRPDPRCSVERQKEICDQYSKQKNVFFIEEKRERGDPYPMRDVWLNSARNEVLGIPEFFRIATTKKDLQEVVQVLTKKGQVVVEAATGRMTSNSADLTDMIFESINTYAARGLTREVASIMGKLGAAASPISQPKPDLMPKEEALPIWTNPDLLGDEAVARINANGKYKDHYSLSLAYRRLGLRGVRPGRRHGVNGHDRKISGKIYFIRNPSNGYIKIGFSTKPLGRLRDLQVGNSDDLEFLAIITGTMHREKLLKRRFKEYNIRGEWFAPGQKLKRFINAQKKRKR
jgi:hypothetical protein